MLIIVDKKGIEIDFGKEDSDEEIGYYKEIELNSIRAEGELKHLIAYLSKFDSAPDIAYSLDHPDNDVTKGFEAY